MGNRAIKLAGMEVATKSQNTLLSTYEHVDPYSKSVQSDYYSYE